MQAEEATNLRADMREVVEELHAHHARHQEMVREVVEELRAHHARYQEMAALRVTTDDRIIEAVGALATVAEALESAAHQADSMPDRVQAVLNSADVTEIHKKLADALTMDIWAQLGAHSDTEARRFADIAGRIEKNVHATVQNLRDANTGKPSLPAINTEGTFTERLSSRARYYYACILRMSADLQPLAVTIASVCAVLTFIAILIGQLSRIHIVH